MLMEDKILNIWGEDMIFIKLTDDKVYVRRTDSEKVFPASLFTLTEKELKQLKEINPGIKAIVCSGYSISGEAREIMKEGAQGFIQKPFDTRRLAKVITEVLDKL